MWRFQLPARLAELTLLAASSSRNPGDPSVLVPPALQDAWSIAHPGLTHTPIVGVHETSFTTEPSTYELLLRKHQYCIEGA
ncbi:hypothetical protein [Nitrosomonas mobilis]|uniref:hypothetical protein n=1 Tax=Nitrosomonas mobilis TaxID=51642 RepID=UPI001C409412|nr:hypothetical protein [Nitrosomonas mobilis]HNO75822.1 hypothetical protein [Nitrosomonas mobilis]